MARNEANGQLSLIGLYPGDMLLVQQSKEQGATFALLPNLHCVVILGDMERVSKLKFQLQVKHGQSEVLTVEAQTIDRVAPRTPLHTLLFGSSPFPCTQGVGEYEFRVTVQPDDAAPTTYSKRFKIERQDPSVAARP